MGLLALLLALAPLAPPPALVAPDDFAQRFTGRTLRFDYRHCGCASEEKIAPERFRLEGEWPGSRAQLEDRLDLGKYRFLVRDAASNALLYSRGFSSIYGEWETTGEAKAGWRSFAESQRFPEPKGKVTLALEKRADDLSWRELWKGELDPAGRAVDRSPPAARLAVTPIFESGPPATKVDLLILGDGYTGKQRDKFVDDVQRLTEALFAIEPFKSRRSDFNCRAILAPSNEPGISDPRGGAWNATPLGLQFNAFDTDRYVLTFRDEALREIAAQAPYDALILLGNSKKYGGGGIYNLWSTCTADSEPARYVFVHEFGHAFGGLADEYYTSQVAYENFTKPGTEPWEPNVTALLDPAHLKWKELVEAGTPLPTPWSQQKYDELDLAYQKRRAEALAQQAGDAVNEQLMREIKAQTKPLLEAEPFAAKVGAFEGAGYQAKGLYRPQVDCIMFTRNPTSFCKVCERAIARVIDACTR